MGAASKCVTSDQADRALCDLIYQAQKREHIRPKERRVMVMASLAT